MRFVDFVISLLRDPRSFIAAQIAAGPLFAYGFVFLIIFVETGVVFFPFLPGDSLLFASGFFAHGGGFGIVPLLLVAWAAAILGDQCNFMIGKFLGQRIVESGKVKAMTPERLEKSEAFLDKWGSVAIFLGRFFPFIRTFVPFLAGMGGMRWRHFLSFNILGGIAWSSLFLLLGYFFGGIPFVQGHFEMLVLGIIGVSVVPILVGAAKSMLAKGDGTGDVTAADEPAVTGAQAAEADASPQQDGATTLPERHHDDMPGHSPRQAGKAGRVARRGAVLGAILLSVALVGASLPSVAVADVVSDYNETKAQRDQTADALDVATSEADETQGRLNELSQQIDEIEKDIRVDRASLREQMKATYKMGQVGGWDAVLGADTIEGMLDTADYSAKIREENTESIKVVMRSTEKLRELKDEASVIYESQAGRRDELSARLGGLDAKVEELSADMEVRLGVGRQAIANSAVAIAGTASPDPYIAGGQCERPSDPRLALYVEEHEKAYPGDIYWASCDRCSGTAIVASGVDDEFPPGPPSAQYEHCESSPKWKNVGSWSYGESCDKLQPGDVLITLGDHIKIFVGNEAVQARFPGSDANMYSGSAGQHQPWCYNESSSYDYREYAIFRYNAVD